jgi:Lipid A disaccharide synthetase
MAAFSRTWNSKSGLDLYITTNSPGEIAGWVAPVVREIRPRVHNCRITLVVLPCQYASGAELSVGAEAGVDRCIRVGEFGAMRKREEERAWDGAKKLVLHLGGDLFFSVCLSRRLKAPLWAYASRPRWGRFVDFFFVPDKGAARRFALLNFPKERYERIGNLILDSVVLKESEAETRAFLDLSPREPLLSFLTGSRPLEYSIATPFFARIASMLLDRFPDYRAVFPLAPTVREDLLQSILVDAGIAWRGESRVYAIEVGKDRWARVVRDRTPEVLNCTTLAIAAPGTNNLQAAALYIPHIMVLPLDRAEEYPLDGILGALPLWIPGFKKMKKSYILRLNSRTPFVSLPNKMAGKLIAPELRGTVTEQDVVDEAARLLASPERLQEISRAFYELTHERGAASRLAERVAAFAADGPQA